MIPQIAGNLILTSSDQDIVVVPSGQNLSIVNITISNGAVAGELTLKIYRSSVPETITIVNSAPIEPNPFFSHDTKYFLGENDKLIGSMTSSTDAQICVFGVSQGASLPPSVEGHIISNEGTPLTQRPEINFIGSLVNATDNVDTTDVTINFSSTEITGKTAVTVAMLDYLLISDTSDSNNLKKVLVSDIVDKLSETVINLGSGNAIDASLGKTFIHNTIAGNTTFTISNVTAGYSFSLAFAYTSGTITLGTGFTTVKWHKDTSPTYTAGQTYDLIFKTNNGTLFEASWLQYTT